jgi:hypothetical protein
VNPVIHRLIDESAHHEANNDSYHGPEYITYRFHRLIPPLMSVPFSIPSPHVHRSPNDNQNDNLPFVNRHLPG